MSLGDKQRTIRCAAPWQSLMIEGNGNIQPCAYRGNYGNAAIHPPLGNANDISLEEVWNGEEIQKLRGWMAEGNLEAAGCAGCLAISQGQQLQLSYDMEVDKPDVPESAYKSNLLLKREEMARGAKIIKSKPLVLYVTPTHRCNLRCTHCYETPTRSDTIRRKSFQEEVEELLPTLSEIVPGGGEPLVLSFWRKLFDDKSNVFNPYLRVAFTTSAHHVDERVFNSMERFADTQVMVSIDAPDKETFEAIRKNAKFEKVVGNLERFRDISTRDRDGATVMHISVMKQNLKLLPELIRLAAALEVPFNFQPVIAYPIDHSLRGYEMGPADVDGWVEALDEAERLIKTLLLPTLVAASRRRNREFSQISANTLTKHISALRNVIPWDMHRKKHFKITGEVPAHLEAYHDFLKDYALKPQHSRQKMYAVFFPYIDDAFGEAHHYAEISKFGTYTAMLPKGRYHAVLVRRENLHIAFNGWDVLVPTAPRTTTPTIADTIGS
jgi:radical SAM protein with 4Fe4S-binding SPASM domain